MWVKYIIPEDGDDFAHPNIFNCGKIERPSLANIKKSFPIPGEFLFRIYTKMSPSLNVWLDIMDENEPLQPRDDGSVMIKCSRIASGGSSSASLAAAPTTVFANNANRPVNPFATSEPNGTSLTSSSSLINNSAESAVPARPQPAVRRGSEKLIQFDDFGSPQHPPPPSLTTSAGGNETDLLGFNSSPLLGAGAGSSTPVQPYGVMKDFLGLDASSPMSSSGNSSSVGISPMGMGMQSNNNFSGNINSAQKQQQQHQQSNNSGNNNSSFVGFSMNPAMNNNVPGMARSTSGIGNVNTTPMGGQHMTGGSQTGQGMNSGYNSNLNVYRNSNSNPSQNNNINGKR